MNAKADMRTGVASFRHIEQCTEVPQEQAQAAFNGNRETEVLYKTIAFVRVAGGGGNHLRESIENISTSILFEGIAMRGAIKSRFDSRYLFAFSSAGLVGDVSWPN